MEGREGRGCGRVKRREKGIQSDREGKERESWTGGDRQRKREIKAESGREKATDKERKRKRRKEAE
jgi:hypothetical protein